MSAQLAALGPFFAADFHDGASASMSPWRTMAELVGDRSILGDRVSAVRAYLAAGVGCDPGAVELRVAASVVHLGLVARVASPLLALTLSGRSLGRIRLADLRWQPQLGSTFPLSIDASILDASRSRNGDLTGRVIGGAVGELTSAISSFGVNRHTLRGNVASALAAAAHTIAADHPELGAQRAFHAMLASADLSGAAQLTADGAFRRRNCCLIYRADPDRKGPLCGDCVLQPRVARRTGVG